MVIAISHVGGMPSLLEAVDVARAQGAKVIALTQPGTPLAALADILLGIEVAPDPVMHVGTEAYLAHLTVIEILTVLVAQRLGDQAVQRLAGVRARWRHAASTCSTTRASTGTRAAAAQATTGTAKR